MFWGPIYRINRAPEHLKHLISCYQFIFFTGLDPSVKMIVIYNHLYRSIQSGEKERTDLSGRSGRGHLVLVCREHRRPRPLSLANRLCRRPETQMGVVKSDFLRCVGADQI